MSLEETQVAAPKLATNETFGQGLARFRKEKGLTQAGLAEEVGIVQVLGVDYEQGKLRLNAEPLNVREITCRKSEAQAKENRKTCRP